jgi:hypothetical protein
MRGLIKLLHGFSLFYFRSSLLIVHRFFLTVPSPLKRNRYLATFENIVKQDISKINNRLQSNI